MKLLFAAFTASTCILLSPAFAANVSDATAGTPAAASKPLDMRLRFNSVVDELAKKAAARKATREDFAGAVQAIKDLANQYLDVHRVTSLHEKMITRMNELEVRARDKMLELMEFDVLKDLAIDIQFDAAMERMAGLVRAGKATRLDYSMMYAALGVRAESAKDFDPEIDAIAGRLMTAWQALEKRAADSIKEADVVPVLSLAADIDARAAVVRLGRRATAERAAEIVVTADFTDVTDTLREGGVPVTSEFMRKVNARLEEIKSAVRGGRITRADFNELFKALLERARAAVTPG